MKKSYIQRVMGFILCLSLIFTNVTNAFALGDASEKFSDAYLSEEYPLIDAFLNGMMDSSVENKRETYVLEFEEGKKEQIVEKLGQIEGLQFKYDYDTLFEGVSVEIPSQKIDFIKSIEGIKNIQKNGEFIPHMVSAHELTKVLEAYDHNESMTGNNPDKRLDGRGTVIAIIDSGLDITHPALRIDEEAKSYVKIKENEVKEGFTLKVPHGFNYISGNHDLLDRVSVGHGMHIAGIIAGNDQGFRGVAPNAQILMYRMFTDRIFLTKDRKGKIIQDPHQYEFVGDDAVYHAMEDAVKHKADVISMSIGRQGGGYTGDIFYNAVQKATQEGVIVVTAIGNYSSSSSTNTYDDYANNEYGIVDTSAMTYYAGIGRSFAVGSTTNNKSKLDKVQIADRKYGYAYLGLNSANKAEMKAFQESLNSLSDQRMEFIYVGHGRESALVNKNVRGKIVVALRGGGRIDEKMKLAADRGAKGFILINAPFSNARDNYYHYPVLEYSYDKIMTDLVKEKKMWAIALSGRDGEALRKQIDLGATTIQFLDEYSEEVFEEQTKLSGFSGWGPNAQLELKPEVVAPGERIYSTINRGQYGYISGTSMATPQVAAMSALLKSRLDELRKRSNFPKMIDRVDLNKIVFMNTALALKEQKEGLENLEISPRRQGAGLVQFDKALKTDVILTHNHKGAVELKEIDGDLLSFEVVLTNLSNDLKSFKLRFGEVLGEGVVVVEKISSSEDGRIKKDFEDDFVREKVKVVHTKKIENADISSESDSIVVGANESTRVKISLNTGDSKNEFVEGYVYFDSQDKSQPDLSIPYFGFKGNWNESKIIDDPMWLESSLFKLTTILGVMPGDHGEREYVELGKNKEGGIIADRIAFSNTNNNRIKWASLRVITLREALDFEVSILDENQQHLRTLSKSNFFKKLIANLPRESSYRAKVVKEANPLFDWDGKLYDKKSGKMVLAQEGQYYYRIRARVKDGAPYQEVILPVKVDNTQPVSSKWNVGEQGASFEVKDDHGIWFVGASIDNKPIALSRGSENEYIVDKSQINELTTSKLRVEAIDYAGNIMKPIEVELNPAKADEDADASDSSAQDNSPQDKSPQDKSPADAQEQGSQSQRGASDYAKTPDNTEEQMRRVFYPFLPTSYQELKAENRNLIEEHGKFYYETDDFDFTWNVGVDPRDYIETPDIEDEDELEEFWEEVTPFERFGLKLTSINTSKNGFTPMTDMTFTEEGQIPEETQIEVKEGTNVVNVTVFEKSNPEKILFSRGYLIVVDVQAPAISENDEHIEYEDDEKASGTFYTKTNSIQIQGTISDNGEDWRLFVNGDSIESNFQNGQFGNNEKAFHATLEVEDGDIVTLEAVDKLNNKKKKTFHVVLDQVAPEITLSPEDTSSYTEETVLNVKYDDHGNPMDPKASNIMVNAKPYEEGMPLSQYGEDKYYIYIVASDKAGNVTTKEIDVKLSEEDKAFAEISLKKKLFTLSELKQVENLVEIPKGYRIEFAKEIDVSKRHTEVIFDVTNPLGLKKQIRFEIEIEDVEKDLEKLELKQRHFLPQELKSASALFDIPAGMSVKISKIDASSPGTKQIQVRFLKNKKVVEAQYEIVILPQLDAKLKNRNFLVGELQDIDKLVKYLPEFRVQYKQIPDFNKTGEQTVAIVISDAYGHSKEMSFTINIYQSNQSIDEIAEEPDHSGGSSSSSGSAPSLHSKVQRITPKEKDVKKPEKTKETLTQPEQKEMAVDKFEDVKGHWAQNVIEKAYADRYIEGYPDGSFKPDNMMLRSEFSKISNKVFKLPQPKNELKFADVNRKDWYYEAIAAQYEAGLIQGVSESKFEPNKALTRAQAVVIFIRYLEQFEKELLLSHTAKSTLPLEKRLDHSSDEKEIPIWARSSFEKAYQIGLIKGDDKNRLLPNQEITRAQVLQIIYNFLQLKQL